MPEFTRGVSSLFRTVLGKRGAQQQGGLLSGNDPTQFNEQDPLRLWIIQVGIIILTAQVLGLVLRKLRQPKVIAEVLGGIILGPTAFGRIPGFTAHIFPEQSLSYLSLVANIGLVLFLFIIGLEIETDVIRKNAKYSVPIALGGMALPFGLGAALSVPIYNHFVDQSIPFTHFMLFTCVAFSITAFPVLCRILTELNLIDTTVGIVVLSAGVGNDIIGWTLLALSVALVNADSKLMSLWILLTAVGWAIFLLFPVKWFFLWLARRTGSTEPENGPSMFFMTVTILMVFGSAFFTDIIGVHAIFGGFVAGLVVPREGGLAIKLTEKLEDMVSIVFLPLYFTLSGLSTDLGLLNDGITWGFTIAICVLAFTGKFGGCASAAKIIGFNWREACTIGTLMSCKGLVELIVLNVGLNAGILSPRVFTMFVLEALLLTFMTTPVVAVLYPPEYRTRASAQGEFGAIVDKPCKHPSNLETNSSATHSEDDRGLFKRRFTVVLDKLEHLPGILAVTHLIVPPLGDDEVESGRGRQPTTSRQQSPAQLTKRTDRIHIDALRLIELSDRTSAVMKSSAAESIVHTDPLLSIYKTFGEINDIPMSTSLSVVRFDELAQSVAEHARDNISQLVLVPWLPPTVSIAQPAQASSPAASPSASPILTNPFDAMFKASTVDKSASVVHSKFIHGIFAESTTDVALFVDRTHDQGDAKGRHGRYHIFLPFFGGPDDRLALEFVVQLCANPKVTATVTKITKANAGDDTSRSSIKLSTETAPSGDDAAAAANIGTNTTTLTSVIGFGDTVYATIRTRLQSETADNITWARYANSNGEGNDHSPTVLDALTRVTFKEMSTSKPLHRVVQETTSHSETASQDKRGLIVVLGRSRGMAVENHGLELREIMAATAVIGGEVKRTIGDVATALVVSGCNVGLVVMQTAGRHLAD